MKRYSFPEKKVYQVLFVLFLFCMLMTSRDTMFCLHLLGFYRTQLVVVLLLAAVGILFLWVQRKNLREIFTDGRMWLILGAAVLMLLPMLVKRDWQLMYFSILLNICAAIFLTYFVSLEQTAKCYVVILTGLSAFSVLATYFLRILPDRGLLSVPVFDNGRVDFYNFFLSIVPIDYVKNRNFGIFREPGVHQFFLLLGLFLNNYTAQWKKSWQLWTVNAVLGFTMLSTFATGGLIEMGLLVIFLFWDKKWYRDKRARYAAYGVILALCVAVAVILIQKNSLYYELVGVFGKFKDSDSGSSRLDSIYMDLQYFLHHPIFGERLSTVLHGVADNTSSTMIQYAAFGAVAGSLHVAAWGFLAWDRKRNILGNLLLLLILFMSFNTQNLIWDLFFWLFPVMAMTERGLPLLSERRRKK